MVYRSPGEIFVLCSELPAGRVRRAAINNLFRGQDESHLWPIRGKFNATKRAITHAQKFERDGGVFDSDLEYCYFISEEIGRIVNGEV